MTAKKPLGAEDSQSENTVLETLENQWPQEPETEIAEGEAENANRGIRATRGTG
jgi:hypothetical protein